MDVFLKALQNCICWLWISLDIYIAISVICLRVSYKSKSNRTPDKNLLSSQRKHKKQKSTPKKEVKHVPIDLFFVKSNQKF